MAEKTKILVVDDEEVIRSLFTDLLSDQGYNVSVAKNGKEATELIKENFFHMVFIDVHMPVMNGVETLKAIKKISPKTSIVMMDSYPDLFLEEALKEGAIACLHKPFNIKEVLEKVEETIGNK